MEINDYQDTEDCQTAIDPEQIEEILSQFDSEVLQNDVRMSTTEYLNKLEAVISQMPFFLRTKRAFLAVVNEAFSSPNFYGKNDSQELPNLYLKASMLLLYPGVAKSDAKNPSFIILYSLVQKHARIIASRTIGKDRERRLQNTKTLETVQKFSQGEEERKSRRGVSIFGGHD